MSHAVADAPRRLDYHKGLLLSAGGMLVISPDALLIQWIEVGSPWEILAIRSPAFCVGILIYLAVRERGRVLRPFLRLGRIGALAALTCAGTNLGFVGALTQTSAASALFIVATTPFWGALFGRVLLGERVRGRTLVAIGLSLLGVGLIAGEGLGAGTMLGNAIALATAVCLGMNVALFRLARTNVVPQALWLGSALATVVGVVMMDTDRLVGAEIGVMILNGGLVLPLALSLYYAGASYVPAAEVALLSVVETLLGPIWVWLGLGAVPSWGTVIGGVIILLALTGNALLARAEERRRAFGTISPNRADKSHAGRKISH